MPSIADATRARRRRQRRRLISGVGLLLIGAVLFGIGAAGIVQAASLRTGVLAGGLAVWACLLGLAVHSTVSERERTLTSTGAAFSLAGLLAFWAFAPAEGLLGLSVPAIGAGLGYLIGLSVVLATTLAAMNARPRRQESGHESRTSRTVGWKRAPDGGTPGQVADGGGRQDDLSFPTDDD